MNKAFATALLISLGALFWTGSAAAEPGRGETIYEERCTACHSLDVNRVGPMHRGVYGRKAGSVKAFPYSQALKESKVVWDEQSLDRWLSNPEAFIPGQRMGYQLSVATDRADVIAFLKARSAPKP
ncbi:MAG TPA: c-type cytochrome [Burkholderiales bacterium]|nr:c-type cytochrome [Burkholderiales bacterium]